MRLARPFQAREGVVRLQIDGDGLDRHATRDENGHAERLAGICVDPCAGGAGHSPLLAQEIELETGAAFAAHPETARARVREALQAIITIYPDRRFAAAYAGLLSTMRPRGRTIGTMDLLIATIAVVEGAALLTGNRKHFEVVPDLRVLSHR